MSRLSDLIRQAKLLNGDLGDALETEVRHLQERRAFGLNFERHTPESVDLYGRPVRLGDKVRMLPPRGETQASDKRLWVVTGGATVGGVRHADLRDPKSDDTATYPVDDLVVVAEHTDVIYPGLVSTGKVERGGDKPFHTVINGENLHALKALLYTHRGKVDAIYIDPPYNTGARDWKYNNDYVESDDLYRHSKWLAFMERRLQLSKELLNPAESVLIVTIDEKEYLRLGLLMEQVIPEARIQVISTVINPKGASLGRDFARVNEFLFVAFLGSIGVQAEVRDMLDERKNTSADTSVKWSSLIRGGAQGIRTDSPGAYYPVFIDIRRATIHSFGEALPWGVSKESVRAPEGTVAVWPPPHPSGVEGRWGIGPAKARELYTAGALRLGKMDANAGKFPLSYLSAGIMDKVASGEILTLGRTQSGALVVSYPTDTKVTQPKTVWNMQSHNAGEYGSKLVSTLLPNRKFPFPKSLYAVEDALRFFVKGKPDAVVLDFFAGSGTTAHAVMRLNRQDGGFRQCISVTNNEVAAVEQTKLRGEFLRPGDSAWESLGICEYITKPRIEAALSGISATGDSLVGDYKFTDEFPMVEGFEENAEFFTLTYEAPLKVATHHDFERIAPLLWLRAGSRGRRIESLESGWDVAEAYGVIERLEAMDDFLAALASRPEARLAFIVTDDERRFQTACASLPDGVEPVRLYESYLRNFQIDAVRSSR